MVTFSCALLAGKDATHSTIGFSGFLRGATVFFLLLSGCSGGGEGDERQTEVPGAVALRTCGVEERALSIMPLGDSITEGERGYSSYRRPLWKNLERSGCVVDLVGSRTGVSTGSRNSPEVPAANPDFDQDHEGHWDYTTGDVRARIEGWYGSNPADIVLVHLGTNDLLRGRSVDEAADNLSAIIQSLRTLNPRVRIALSQVKAVRGEDVRFGRLNARISSLATELTTPESPLLVVDQATGFFLDSDTYDGIHPDRSGEEKLAGNFTNVILEFVAGSEPE